MGWREKESLPLQDRPSLPNSYPSLQPHSNDPSLFVHSPCSQPPLLLAHSLTSEGKEI